MRFFIIFFIIIPLPAFAQKEIELYKKMILDHAEILNDYPEGMVFLKKIPYPWDALWIRVNEGDAVLSIPCHGGSETKSTILLSGWDDNAHFGLYRNENYYELEEKTFLFDKNDSDFNLCKNHFGGEAPILKKIYQRKKRRITLLDFKNLFRDKIFEVKALDKDRIKINIGQQAFTTDSPYCGPLPPGFPDEYYIKNKNLEGVEKILDLSRPWEFAEEIVTHKRESRDVLKFTRERLADVNPWKLYEQIKDIEVDLGTYSYLLPQNCKKEDYFPKKKWSEIIKFRPPWQEKI